MTEHDQNFESSDSPTLDESSVKKDTQHNLFVQQKQSQRLLVKIGIPKILARSNEKLEEVVLSTLPPKTLFSGPKIALIAGYSNFSLD